MPKKPSGVILTAAERYARAVEREAEVTAQLAAVDANIQKAQESLQTLGTYGGRTLAQQVAAAEHAEDGAMAALLDATSQVAIDEGSELEEAAREALAAAEAHHTETRQALADLRAWQVKVEGEAETVKVQLAEDKQRRGELAKLAAAFARQVATVKRLAGVEKVQAAEIEREAITARILAAEQELQAAQQQLSAHYGVVAAIKAEHQDLADTREVLALSEPDDRALFAILAAFDHFLATVEGNAEHPEALAVWHHGRFLPSLLADSRLSQDVYHNVLAAKGRRRGDMTTLGAVRRDIAALRTVAESAHERELESLPPASVA